jgi:hypothetical protein
LPESLVAVFDVDCEPESLLNGSEALPLLVAVYPLELLANIEGLRSSYERKETAAPLAVIIRGKTLKTTRETILSAGLSKKVLVISVTHHINCM